MAFLNSALGFVLLVFSVIMGNTLPMMVVRQMVKDKDMEIREHFADLYLMLHYILIADTKIPLSGVFKSFGKNTDSDEMRRFIDVCIHYIDIYGEYEATNYIAKDYRELSEVNKLMRLIRQAK